MVGVVGVLCVDYLSVFLDIYFSIIKTKEQRKSVNHMISYLVKKITEEDFGCEDRPEGYEPMVQVDLRADSGDEICIKAKDKELYEKDINEGDWVYFDLNDKIFKEK